MFSRFSSPRSIFILLLLWLLTACQPPAEQTATRPTKEPTLPPTIAPTNPTTPMIPTNTPTPIPTATQPPTPIPTATLPPQPGRILYLAAQASDQIGYSADGEGQLFILPLNNAGEAASEPTLFAAGTPVEFGPLVSSPDGSRVLIIDKTEGGDVLTTIYPETGQSFGVTDILGNIFQFSQWYPDNRQILAWNDFKGLWLINVDTGIYQMLFADDPTDIVLTRATSAAASPNGEIIVYVVNSNSAFQLWSLDVDNNKHYFLWEAEMITDLTWSPDGQFIAFVGAVGDQQGVIVINADGSNPRSISQSFTYGYAYPIIWSPDSRRLAFNGIESPAPALDASQFPDHFRNTLYVVDVVTGEEKILLPDGTGSADPSWSPDGQQLVFSSYRSGNSEIWAVNVDGSYLRQLTHQEELVRFPVWLPAVP